MKEKQQVAAQIKKLLDIMASLRNPDGGCPWDLEQDFSTIAPYTIEEAYEVADAIQRGNFADLRDELGDLLFQVVFHARMAEEAGHFEFVDTVDAICDKMLRRHPHVFADTDVDDAEAQSIAWEEHKAAERRSKQQGVLADIPLALPALTRAEKLGKRAARAGFDWPDVSGPLQKITEELAELSLEIINAEKAPDGHNGQNNDDGSTAKHRERLASELGDLLFAVVNVGRHLQVDAEQALRGANGRFEARFAHIEAELAKTGESAQNAGLERLEALWEQAKSLGL